MPDNPLDQMLVNEMQSFSSVQSNEVVHEVTYDLQTADPDHAYARSALGVKLSYADFMLKSAEPEWWVLDQPQLQIKSHILIPDLAGWKREQQPVEPEQVVVECIPDWICEILSASTEEKDRTVKQPLYAELGVNHLWLINPASQTLETYRLENTQWRLTATLKKDDRVSEPPFSNLLFSLDNLWSK